MDSVPFRTDDAPVLRYSVVSASSAPSVSNVNDPSGEIRLASAPASGPGSFRLAVTDAPAGFDAIYVRFSKIQMRNKDTRERIVLATDSPEVNLLSLRDGISQVFSEVSLAPGVYHDLRFSISSVAVVSGGQRINVAVSHELQEHGLRVYGSFVVRAGDSAEAVIDFDVSRMFLYSHGGWTFRPVAKLRHLHFKPSGIHFEPASDGSMNLVGPAKSVRARAWVQITEQNGEVTRQRAAADGSFRFDGIDKVFGKVEFAVVERRGGGGHHRGGGHDDDDRDGPHGYQWVRIAWMDFLLDFQADSKYPHILASHLDGLFRASWEASGKNSTAFLALFSTDAFRYLAGLYVQAVGASVPGSFVFPSLPVPFPFALEGPDYDLPGYASVVDGLGYFTGGPSGSGCSDARVVFEGIGINDYAGLSAENGLRKMMEAGLPFTGLLAEYEVACRSRNLASLSCGTLGQLAVGGSSSLPAEPLSSIHSALNSPRGGILVSLLNCMESGAQNLSEVEVADFPSSQPGCWFGCSGEGSASYVAASDLIAKPNFDALVPDASAVLDLDSLVSVANSAGVAPLRLLASYVAHYAESKVNGFVDLKAPRLFNLQPADGSVTDIASAIVSGLSSDRTVSSVSINGAPAAFSLGTDGLIHIDPVTVGLVHGVNVIEIAATDEAGNVGTAQLTVIAQLPQPSPAPTPTETGIPGVDFSCAQGQFVPKPVITVGLSIDPANTAFAIIQNGLASLGYPPIVYSQAEIAAGQPIADGITVLVISRVVTAGPASQAYIDGVKAYIANGGSVLGEFDGAALFFTNFATPTNLILNLTPSFQLFSGLATGGASLLPQITSTVYVSDAADPLMAGLPASFLSGTRSAFAISGFNDTWLHTAATFNSTGSGGLLPVGTFPAVMSGRCGSGRVALYTMNHLNVMTVSPVSTMVQNTMNWLVGQ